MQIGIVGAGAIRQVYGRLWKEAGHRVVLSARDETKVARVAEALGLEAGTPEAAVRSADAVLLAVNYVGVDDAVRRLRGALEGKLVVDATNPLRIGDDGRLVRTIADDEIAVEVMVRKLPRSRLAKSFTTLWSGHVEKQADRGRLRIAMPFVAQHGEDRERVAFLVRDADFVPVDLGGLEAGAALDPQSSIWNVVMTPEELRERLGFRAEAPSS